MYSICTRKGLLHNTEDFYRYQASLLVIVYALGAGVPMMAIAYGSQCLTTKVRRFVKYSARLQQVLSVLILLLAVAMYFQYDILIQNKLTSFFP